MQTPAMCSIFSSIKRKELCTAAQNAALQTVHQKRHCKEVITEGQVTLPNQALADLGECLAPAKASIEDGKLRENIVTTSSNLDSQYDMPACWSEDQAEYFKCNNPWLQMREGRLGCCLCNKIGSLGLHAQTRGVRISKEWSQCSVASVAGGAKKAQQTALRKKIWEHRESHGHKVAEKIVLQAKNGEFENNVQKQNAKQEETTNRVFRTAYMVAKLDRPFTDMPVVINLQEANGLHMGRILQSRKSCADICDFIGEEMKSKLTQHILERNLKFSILIDEYTTVSHLSVLSLCIRAAFSDDPEPTTIFWELIELEHLTADAITKELLVCLKKHFPENVITKKFISFTADGASTMIGRVSGVAAQLKKSENYPNILVWHCCNHRLELAVGDVLKDVSGTFNLKAFMDSIYALNHSSPKNQRELHNCADELALLFRTVGRVLDTRWVASSCRSVTVVWKLYSALAAHFQFAAADPKRSSSEKAKYRGLLERLTSVEFVKNLGVMRDALSELAQLSLRLQGNSITLPEAHRFICRQIKVFEALAGDREGEFTNLATEAANKLDFQGVLLHAGRKVDVEIKRQQFFRSLSNALQNRLMTTASSHVASCTGDTWELEYDELICACKVVYPKYWPDNYDILYGENEVRRLCRRFQLPTAEIVDGFREYKDNGGKHVPYEMRPLFITLKTIAISTAECERVFSHMNNTVTQIRNSLKINRVGNLLFLNRNGPPLKDFNPEVYVRSWLLQGRRSADHTACRAWEHNEEEWDMKRSVWSLL